MPRYGQRTNPYYPGGEQDVSPETLGGMAYNPYSSGTDWGFALRNALNNLIATRQGQEEQRRAEEELHRKAGLEERGAAAEEGRLNLEGKRVALEIQKQEDERRMARRKLMGLEPTEAEIKAAEFQKANPQLTKEQAMSAYLKYKTPEQQKEEFKWERETGAQIEAKYRKPEDYNWRISQSQKGLIGSLILRNSQTADKLKKDRIAIDKSINTGLTKYVDFDSTTGGPKTSRGRSLTKSLNVIDTRIEELENSNAELGELQIQTSEGVPLDDERLARVYSILRGEKKKKQELGLIDVLTGVGKALFGGGNVPQ